MGELIAFLSLFFFSLNVIVTKVASDRLDINLGFFISISVNVLFSGFLLLIQFLLGDPVGEIHWVGFCLFMFAGLFSSYLGRFLYYDSIAKLGPSKASTIMVSNPLFTCLISWIFLGEVITAIEMAAVFIVLFGLFLVSYVPKKMGTPISALQGADEIAVTTMDAPVSKTGRLRKFIQPGIFFALLGTISYALGNIIRGTAIQDWNEPILGGFLGAFTGAVLQLVFHKQARSLITSIRSANKKAVWLFVASGVLTISAQIGYIAAMQYMPISIATLITSSQPLLVIPLSYFLLKNQEGINLRTVTGSLAVLLGIGTIILL